MTVDSPYTTPNTQNDPPSVDQKDRKALSTARVLALSSIGLSWVIYYLAYKLELVPKGESFDTWLDELIRILAWKRGLLTRTIVLGAAVLSLGLSFTGRKQPTLGLAIGAMGLTAVVLVILFGAFQWSIRF